MKYIYILGIIAVLLVAGCSSAVDDNAAPSTGTIVKDAPERAPDANSLGSDAATANATGSGAEVIALPVPDDGSIPEAVVVEESSAVKNFDLIAKQWDFVPDTITVKKGDTVKLSIESIDVAHGFALPDFGVNEYLSPGNKVNVEFVADKAGTYTFFCSVQCGSGHREMRGKLVVE